MPHAAQGEFKLRYRIIDYRELEFEHIGDVTFGPLVQKQMEILGLDSLRTANLLVSKEIGRNRSDATPIATESQSVLRLDPLLA